MHGHDNAGRTGAGTGRAPAGEPASAASAQLRGLLGVQAGAGNAAVIQLLRRNGHPWAQEEHEHSAGCGHQQAEPARQAEMRQAGVQAEVPPAVQRSAVHDVLRTSGRPLDDTTRTDMEARLGADFSDVRIHNDSAARASAAEVGARAYTSSNHIVIGDGGGDQHTLAHELTHVIQQRRGPVVGTDNGDGLKVSDPSDRFEREAEATAARVMAAGPRAGEDVQRRMAPSHRQAGPFVQRAYDHADPDNPQNVMTTEHWERAAGLRGADGTSSREMAEETSRLRATGKKNQKNQKSQKKTAKGTTRTMDEIIKTVGPALLRDLAAKPPASGSLELFRSMSHAEAEGVLSYWGSEAQRAALAYVEQGGGTAKEFKTQHKGMTIGAHLGDQEQADYYHDLAGDSYQVQLKFTLKPGAHELLFTSDHMALGPGHKTELIHKAMGGEHQAATGNEGTLPGYVGMKAEKNEPYSLAIAQGAKNKNGREAGPSQLLFQLFVQDVSLVKNKSGLPLPGQ
ncbi:DUF4157 domain-containing protein [Streptomyces sp. SID10853]|uniref:eCIS core domain-containing protein n=1 Tax=Streptomyces sp. SID10853 TaxID=2706028 RepID=UPI0013C16824|nr:DUF4157 domain-containing protein [Streptomyces sp. SID10853]NDZ78956.1 DUF4157 domain-containing protein [Streptomyces sp. SID10853]